MNQFEGFLYIKDEYLEKDSRSPNAIQLMNLIEKYVFIHINVTINNNKEEL